MGRQALAALSAASTVAALLACGHRGITPGATPPRASEGATSTATSEPANPLALRIAADSFLAYTQSQTNSAVWADLSDASRLRARDRLDAIATALHAIDRTTLASSADQLLYDNLRESADASIGARVCRSYLWTITSQFSGWHVAASNAARVQAVGSENARARALAVFRELPSVIAAERDMLQRGLDSGYTQSRPVVDAVIRQYDDLLPADPTRSPLYAPALRDSSATFRMAWRALLADTIYPAARAQQAFLRDRYRSRARTEGSLVSLPDGAACYAASLRAQTSADGDVADVMVSARADVDRITRELTPLVLESTGERDVSRGIVLLRSDPRFTFPSRDSVLAAYRTMTARAASRIDRVVAEFRPESVVVVPYPEFQERANLPPQYIRASADGTRPAQFLVNLGRTERMSVADAVAHEAYPGHHLQSIAAARGAVVHPVMRTLFVGGFIEGWGIYSEQLAGEMGLYETPLDRAGALVHLLDTAMAAWLDVAYHTRGWTRADLADSMVVLGGRPRAMAEAYADRHAATPGQLATYYIGYRSIRADRERAERALGSAFSSPLFHREVLRDGSITLASLSAKVDRWIAERHARR